MEAALYYGIQSHFMKHCPDEGVLHTKKLKKRTHIRSKAVVGLCSGAAFVKKDPILRKGRPSKKGPYTS